MSPDAMNALFKPTIDSIIEHLRKYPVKVWLLDEAELIPAFPMSPKSTYAGVLAEGTGQP